MIVTPPISKKYISSLIPKGSCILDIGSFDGKDAQELATLCKSNVHCFEPTSGSYEGLKKLEDSRLFLWPYAVGSFNGTTVINLSPNHPQSNTLKSFAGHKKAFPNINFEGTEQINVITLDSWNISFRKSAPVDFIWCDVNGSEADFLIGASHTLTRTLYLYIEFCIKPLFDKSLSRDQIEKALPGFEVIGEYSVGENYGNLLMKNKHYVRQNKK